MSSKILLRRGTAAQWSSANPILGIGELGIETDTLKIKIGNGTSTWTQLTSYANVTPSQLTSEINNLINAAPSTLDTLNELAAAINNDASFSTTVNNLLTGKVSKSGGDTITASTASTIGLIIKGAVSQTANLQEWQDSSGTTISWVNSTGGISLPRTALIRFNGGVGVDRAYITSNTNNDLIFATAGGAEGFRLYGGSTPSGALITNSNANAAGFIIKGAASQASNLQEWKNSAGTVLSSIDNGGNLYAPFVWINGYQYAQAAITSSSAVLPALILKGASSQTADLQQWQNSSASVLAKVDSLGNITATDYKLSNSLYNIKKTLKKTIDPAQNAIAGNTYDLFQIAFSSSLQGIFTMQVSIRNGGYGQSMSYTLPVTYVMDWLAQYGITNPFTDSTTWVDLTPITFAPRHLMTNDYLKFQARVNANIIFFRIKLTGQLTSNPLFDVYIQHSEEFANSTVTELFSTGTDFTTAGVLPNFLSSKAGATSIFNPVTITSSLASTVPLKIKSATSQSANLQEWQSPAGSIISRIDSNGVFNAAAYDFGVGAGYPEIIWGGNNTTGTIRREYRSSISKFGITTGTFHFGSNPDNANFALTDNQVGVFARSTTLPSFIIKSVASQTANLQEWQNSAGTILGEVVYTGQYINRTQIYADNTQSGSAALVAKTNYGNVTPFVVQGAADAQTADLQKWITHGGTVLAKVDGNGSATFTGSASTNAISAYAGASGNYVFQGFNQSNNLTSIIYQSGEIYSASNIYIQGAANYNASVNVKPGSTSTSGIVVRGLTSQSADLQQWQNVGGTVLARIGSAGGITLAANTGITSSGANNGFYGAEGDWGVYRDNAVATFKSPTDIYFTSAYGGTIYAQLPTKITNPYSYYVSFIVKGAASQTSNLQEWQDSAGTVLSRITSSGQLGVPNVYSVNGSGAYITMNSTSGAVVINTNAAGNIGTIIRGSASQTANLQEWQNSAGTLLASVSSSGGFGIPAIGNPASAGPYQSFNSTDITITSRAPSNIGLIVKGAASQTANLQEWQNSSGTVLAKIDKDGNVIATNLTDSGWVTPTLSNSFVSGGVTPGYRLLNGVVYFRGNVNSGTPATTAFTLPSGYRPAVTTVITVQKFGTADFSYVTINTDGTLQPSHASAWLSGVSFPIG